MRLPGLIKQQDDQVLWLPPQSDALPLRCLDLDLATQRAFGVMQLVRIGQQLQAVAMLGNDFTDAAHQVPVGREFPARK